MLNIRNARHAEDRRPLDEACRCPSCRAYSRAYIHHLVRSDEILGIVLLTGHNLFYYQDLMRDIRASIEAGRFAEFAVEFARGRAEGDVDPG